MTRSHVAGAEEYIRAVLAGEIPACKWIKAACQRQLDDLARPRSDDWPYEFRPEPAERVCRFIERLPHIKGKWARNRERIRLEGWQQFILTTVFGWYHADKGVRRFRTVYEEVPRKNAKSTKISGIGLYLFAADGEAGSEVYSAATTRDQAKIVFGVARAMARKEPGLRDTLGITVNAHNLAIEETESKFEPLSSDAHSLEGLNPHGALIDELHAHKTREVYDVLEAAMGARSQPLLWVITTAGSNRAGVCYEVRTYGTKVLNNTLLQHPELSERVDGGSVVDETMFVAIYTIDDGDDWTDPQVWAKANPNLGVSVDAEDMERLCRKAQEMPSALPNFLTKRLNVWVNADSNWMDMRAWDRCGDQRLTFDQFYGEPCVGGLDLASKVDIASYMRLFWRDHGMGQCLRCQGTGKEEEEACRRCDGTGKTVERHYYAFGKFYLPHDRIEATGNSQYAGWELEGRLITTPGNVIDFSRIEEDLISDVSLVEMQGVGFDPHQATQFSTRMMEEGIPMVEVRPTVLNFSEPMKELEALVLSGRFHHDGDPILSWMVSNVVCHRDHKGNIYPRKEREENKIDGVVALLMCLNLAMREEAVGSIYETRGIMTV